VPSVEASGVGPIAIAVDTSASIGAEELEQFGGEISAVAEQARPEAVHVVYCDTGAKRRWRHRFSPGYYLGERERVASSLSDRSHRSVLSLVSGTDGLPGVLVY